MKTAKPMYSVFVNSSDGFDDCWVPFFTLLKKYWPECTAPIYLNTERKTYRHADIQINSTQVQRNAATRQTWSECLQAGLAMLETPLVLYFQEDYFIHQPVLDERIQQAVKHMFENPTVLHVGLTKHGSHGPFGEYPLTGFKTIDPKAKYRISTQAGLWRIDALKSYLQSRENGWMFEIYGTWRAHKRTECFLTAQCDNKHGGPPIDYLHTGIIKGQWLPQIPEVFKINNIYVDFSKRGFYQQKNTLLRKMETASRLLQHPLYFLKQLF